MEQQLPTPTLLSQRIDTTAQESPNLPWAEIVLSFSPLSTFKIDYSQLASAISYVSKLITDAVGPRAPGSSQLALWYSGPSDLRYAIFMIACSKVGHKALFISPRNSKTAHARLLAAVSCTNVFTSDPSWVKWMVPGAKLKIFSFPEVLDLFKVSKDFPLAPNRHFHEAADDIFVVLHTSGSTNYPKPIQLPNRGVAVYDNFPYLPKVNGESMQDFQFRKGQKLYCAFPLFHKAGCDVVHQSFSYQFSLVFAPLDKVPSALVLADMLRSGIPDCGALPPSVLEDFSARSELLPLLSQFKHIGFGGAPLNVPAGEAIRQYTTLRNILGSTEAAGFPELMAAKGSEDWSYHNFHPKLGIEFEHHSEDMYEAVIVRNPELAPFQMVFHVFPELAVFRTGDLYSKHPTKADLWEYRGRADNLIVLSNGEKLSPDEVENVISAREDVDWALVLGDAHFEPALLIRPAEGFSPEYFDVAFHDEVAKSASKLLPDHAQIGHEYVWIIDPDECPELPKSAKGKLQRKTAVKLMEGIIEDFYEETSHSEGYGSTDLDFSTPVTLAASLERCLKLACPGVALHNPDDDFFTHGMDSLQALRFFRSIRSGLEYHAVPGWDHMSVQFIYAYPSLRKMVHALSLTAEDEPTLTASELDLIDLGETTTQIQHRIIKQIQVGQRNKTGVVLTGSTGSLGCYILDALMREPSVGAIYCLNRRSNQETVIRQRELHQARGLRTDFSEGNVVFLQADLSDEFLGLKLETYFGMLRTVNYIVHNAWFVNWTAPVAAFKPLLEGCANIVSFCQRSSQQPHIIFCSSVGAVNSWQEVAEKPDEPVPEIKMEDLRDAEPTPYSRSKLAAEHIFDHARNTLGLNITICRIGQIAGPVLRRKGSWANQNEWFPSLMLASNRLGMVPADLGCLDRVDWMPVDVLAEVITSLVSGARNIPARRESNLPRFANPFDKSGSRTLTSITTVRRGSALRGIAGDADTPKSPTSSRKYSVAMQPVNGDFGIGKGASTRFLHFVHPYPISWAADGVPAAVKALQLQEPKVVPLEVWLSEFQKAMDVDKELEESSAARLLDFYETIADPRKPRRAYATALSCMECPALSSVPQIRPDQLEGWIKQWVK